jgi:hypothetical protein
MWRLTLKITSGLIIALGVLHCVSTAFNYDSFSLDAMWFLGSGVAIILAGFLNIAVIRVGGKDRVIKYMALTTDLIFSALFSVALLSLTQPQVLVGSLLFAVAAVSVAMIGRQ